MLPRPYFQVREPLLVANQSSSPYATLARLFRRELHYAVAGSVAERYYRKRVPMKHTHHLLLVQL